MKQNVQTGLFKVFTIGIKDVKFILWCLQNSAKERKKCFLPIVPLCDVSHFIDAKKSQYRELRMSQSENDFGHSPSTVAKNNTNKGPVSVPTFPTYPFCLYTHGYNKKE